MLSEIVPFAMFDEERLCERMEDCGNAVEYWSTEYRKALSPSSRNHPRFVFWV
jgi:hypothetical protein